MLRGMSTINLWADDLSAATRWYTELLGVNRITPARPPGAGQVTSSSASATTSTNWTSSTGNSLHPNLPQALAVPSCRWHVDDVAATLDRLVSLGAKPLDAHRARRPRVRHRLSRRPLRQRLRHHVQPPLSRHPGRPRRSAVGAPLPPSDPRVDEACRQRGPGDRLPRRRGVRDLAGRACRPAGRGVAEDREEGSGVPSLTADEAVDLGLCHCWISGQRKSYDEIYYLQKYVPRRPGSRWSHVNVAKVEELIASGRMRPSRLVEVEAAKADGRWAAPYEPQRNATVPTDLVAALAASPHAAQAFDALGKTQQYAVIVKFVTARTAKARATQLRRGMTALQTGDAS